MRTILFTLLGLGFLVACGNNRPNPDGNKLCGGLAPRPCAATEYCDFASNNCGTGDQTGICKPRPELCTAITGPPTCACNGTVYSSECVAYRDGSDLDARGSCQVAVGKFICGYTQCDLGTQYCLREPHGAADTYSCVTLPACASTPAICACLAGERCGNACTGNATVGLTLTCS